MHIILLKCRHLQIAFLKFTSCENQALVGVYSNCCCSCSFEPEIIRIGQSFHKMYSNKILNFQESRTILNACTKKYGNLLNAPHSLVKNDLLTYEKNCWMIYCCYGSVIISFVLLSWKEQSTNGKNKVNPKLLIWFILVICFVKHHLYVIFKLWRG